MRRALLSIAVVASVVGFAEKASANFIGLDCPRHNENQNCPIRQLNSDSPHESNLNCLNGESKHLWSITDSCKHKGIDWKELGNCNLSKENEKLGGDGGCERRDDDCDHSHSTTPGVTPSGSSVPLPPAALGGLATLLGAIGFAKVRKPISA